MINVMKIVFRELYRPGHWVVLVVTVVEIWMIMWLINRFCGWMWSKTGLQFKPKRVKRMYLTE